MSGALNEKGKGPGLVGGIAGIRLERSLGSSLAHLTSAKGGRCMLTFLKPPGASMSERFLPGLDSVSPSALLTLCALLSGPCLFILLAPVCLSLCLSITWPKAGASLTVLLGDR